VKKADRSRREFLFTLGRSFLFGGLATAAGFLSLRRGRVIAAGRDCTGVNQCAACTELLRCGLPNAFDVMPTTAGGTVWQVDPSLCVRCGQCAVNCVLTPSAVKAVHTYDICGYCKLCFGYFQPGALLLDEGAENQLCPVGAIGRTFIENPYYEYTVDETLCVGCGKCVQGCATFGNGSLYLQVRHDRCLNCNECSVAVHCPAGAYRRVPSSKPYLLKETGVA
jgi:electron transport complex protein RnfB